MNLIDLLLLVFLLLGLFKGYRKGLLNSLVGLFSSIIGLIVALSTHVYFLSWLDGKYQLTAKLSQYFAKHLIISDSMSQLEVSSLPFSDTGAAWQNLHLPEKLKTELTAFAESIGESMGQMGAANLGDILYLFLAEIVLKILLIIVIWFVVNKGLCLLSHFVTNLFADTFIASLNKLGGLCIGALIRVLILTIIIGLGSPILNVAQHAEPSFLSAVLKSISEAQLVPYFVSLFSLLSEQIWLFWG